VNEWNRPTRLLLLLLLSLLLISLLFPVPLPNLDPTPHLVTMRVGERDHDDHTHHKQAKYNECHTSDEYNSNQHYRHNLIH
jgi:hypothetical protein